MFGFVPSKKQGMNRERVGVFVIAATDFELNVLNFSFVHENSFAKALSIKEW